MIATVVVVAAVGHPKVPTLTDLCPATTTAKTERHCTFLGSSAMPIIHASTMKLTGRHMLDDQL
jgi:hypothetical protein